jgi:drug/metabolite transporter (DMT)-like permease
MQPQRLLDPVLARQARLLLIGTTLLWGASFPLMRGLQLAQQAHAPHVPDRVLTCGDLAARFGLATCFLLILYGRQLGSATRREWSQGLGLGALSGVGLFLQTLGLAWTDASISAFLTQLGCLVVPLIVALRDRRAPSLRVMVACVLVLFGVALLSPGLLSHFVLGAGEILTLLCAVFFAAQVVFLERPGDAANRPGPVTLIMFGLITLIFAAGFPLFGGTAAQAARLFDAGPIFALLLTVVLFCTLLNFLIMNAWQARIRATEAALIYSLEPVVATVLAAIVPGWISSFAGVAYPDETLRWGLLGGGALILAATVLVATEPTS